MGGQDAKLEGPDLKQDGAAELADGAMLLCHADGQNVLLVRRGDDVFAVGATCTHYGGPLAEGLVVDGTLRCPWHHACFDLATGHASGGPALSPLDCWKVEKRDDKIFVGDKLPPHRPARAASPPAPGQVVIVGAGAAGHACAEMLRREGYVGRLTLIGDEPPGPVDRPNLSKDYLAGNAPEEWIPLRPPEFFVENGIELVLGTRVTAVDTAQRAVMLADGRTRPYDALVLATGADPIRLPIPGGDLPHVHTLRTLADSRAIIAKSPHVVRAVVIGASFIGLEAAASLRARNIDVHVVAPEARPLERVLGPELGDFIRSLHEDKGVAFHLGHTPKSIDDKKVVLDDGSEITADLVVMGVGVRPVVGLAEAAGLKVDRGIVVDEYLVTSAPGVWAVGDVARYPDPRTGQLVRIEHWVVAERQGQTAARNILGKAQKFRSVPFFWSQHYDVQVSYVGHAEKWDKLEVDGSFAERNAKVSYFAGGKLLAVATIFRDKESLEIEASMERDG
jgi:NADPH-dependent 2,4-dienoyl-CoA reductase/sulfur reductase-like enzyme/nitrite reductase/ring-hydroxylating ferredoxin subunit